MSIVRFTRTHEGRIGRVGLAVAVLLGLTGTGVASAGSSPLEGTAPVPMNISGRITDAATGLGVAGMCVNVTVTSKNTVTTLGTGASRSNGDYDVTWTEGYEPSPGQYDVNATPYCGAAGKWQATSTPGEVTVTAVPGESFVSGIDMQTVRSGRFVGKITDAETGQPIAGVSVGFGAVGGTPVPPDTVREVTTAADGSYVLGGLEAGTYVIRVNQTDYVGVGAYPTRSQYGYLSDFVHHVPETSSADAQQFTLAVGQSPVVNESIHEADSVTGTVTDSTTGLPVEGAQVDAWGGSVWNDTFAYTAGVSDATGHYEISGLGPGTYTICFLFPGTTPLQKFAYECWKDQPTDDGANPVQVDGFGATVHGIDQTLDTTSSPS